MSDFTTNSAVAAAITPLVVVTKATICLSLSRGGIMGGLFWCFAKCWSRDCDFCPWLPRGAISRLLSDFPRFYSALLHAVVRHLREQSQAHVLSFKPQANLIEYPC